MPASVCQSQFRLLPSDFESESDIYPRNVLDKDQQQVDLSQSTSWTAEIDQIHIQEFAETQVINAWAPYMLCAGLRRLMCSGDYAARFIVNVTSMEGKFSRLFKSSAHSHTNMSKAALNMLTRTCGSYFADSRVYMTCVDTGWVSEMNPTYVYSGERTVPLDEVDGAMRVLDPLLKGINEKVYSHSKFFKDYQETSW